MTEPEQVARLSRPHTYAEDRLGLKLHPRQAGVLKDLFPTGGKKSHVSARCSNEIGKTTHILAAAILYAIEILGAQVISTAGVWMQVAQQLIPALKLHRDKYPHWDFQDSGIKIDGIDRYIGFSTRDEGFAQGFHRREGMPLFAACDEAAAVPDVIIRSVEDRCNPDYFLVMGSPLDPAGMFYDIEHKLSALYTHHHINQFHCLKEDGYWLDRADIERKIAKWGESSQFVQSNVFGEFADIVAGAIISLGEFDAALNSAPMWRRSVNDRKAFLDFAAGRAKNVFAVRIGNKVWIEKKWVDVNTMSACGEFLATFLKLKEQYGLQDYEVCADDDGLGHPMIDRLHEMGFKCQRFHGGGKPLYDDQYANAVSEAWGEGAAQIKRKEIIVCPDTEFKAQMLVRRLKRNSSGKFQLESKEDLAKRGLDSPDEADAVLGAMLPLPMISRNVMGDDVPVARTKDEIWGPNETDSDQPEHYILPGTHFG